MGCEVILRMALGGRTGIINVNWTMPQSHSYRVTQKISGKSLTLCNFKCLIVRVMKLWAWRSLLISKLDNDELSKLWYFLVILNWNWYSETHAAPSSIFNLKTSVSITKYICLEIICIISAFFASTVLSVPTTVVVLILLHN
jgi:hypothetical protein